jgi:hypothetical protein
MRPAFECPGCGHNAFKLYFHHGRFSGCYRCIGVPYASQQRSRKDRPRLQAARLKVFLGGLPDGTKTPAKPSLNAPGHLFSARSPLSHKVWHPATAYDSQRYALT